jgi:hypothetical protein
LLYAAIATALLAVPVISLAWTGPTAAPPGNNVAAPLNVSANDQEKAGWIGLNNLSIFKDMIISGVHGGLEPDIRYLNFGPTSLAGSTLGNTGYGIRDNGGIMEFRNNGTLAMNPWMSIQEIIAATCAGGACGGGGSWTASGNDIYNTNTGNVGIGTGSPA